MSELVLTALAGRPHRNNGSLTNAHCLLTLYVGGSGAWTAHDLHSGRTAVVRSRGNVETELVALAGLFGDLPGVMAAAPETLPGAGAGAEMKFTTAQWQALFNAAEASGVEVGAVVSGPDTELLQRVGRMLDELGWSTMVCGPVVDARRSQWDQQPSRTPAP
jgi:hypothetical protein